MKDNENRPHKPPTPLSLWLEGKTPEILLSDAQSKLFFQELKIQGFEQSGETLQVHGLSGIYYIDTHTDDKGNVVARRYGGRRPTAIDIYIPTIPSTPDTTTPNTMPKDHEIIKLLIDTISND